MFIGTKAIKKLFWSKHYLPKISVLSVLPYFLPEFLRQPVGGVGGQGLHEHLEDQTEHILLHPQNSPLDSLQLLGVVENSLKYLDGLTELLLCERLVRRGNPRIGAGVVVFAAVVFVVGLVVVLALYQLLPGDGLNLSLENTG